MCGCLYFSEDLSPSGSTQCDQSLPDPASVPGKPDPDCVAHPHKCVAQTEQTGACICWN